MRDWQQESLLLRNPLRDLVVAALRAGTVTTGVVAVDKLLAVGTTIGRAAEDWSAAVFDIPQRCLMGWKHAGVELLSIGRSMATDYVRHFDHGV